MSSKSTDQLLDLSSPEAVHLTVSDLLSHLKWTCFSDDFTLATDILSAREDKAARDLHLLEEKRNAFEEEVKARAKEIHELREQMAKEKDEHQISLSELRGEMERDRKAREETAMKDRNLLEEKRNALEQVVKSCEEEIGELREQMAKEKTCLFELSGEMERDKRAAKVLVAGLREEQTLEMQARDEKSKKDYNLLEEKCNALEEEVKLCKEEIDELREQMVKKKTCLLKLSGEMERDKRATEALVARLRKEQTWEMQARDEKSKKDYNLLEQNHTALMASNLQIQEELESCKKENSELREEMTRLKDEHEKDVVELQGQVTSMECDKRMAETSVERYCSRFENLIMRVKRLEDDAKVLLTPSDQPQDDEATDDNGETRGQPTEEIACGCKEQKKDDPSTFKTDPVMPIMPKIEAINISNKMGPPRNERNSARIVIEISDSDDEQPMGIDNDGIGSYSQVAGGETKLTQDSGVKLKDSCGFGCPMTPSTSPCNDIESSGTSTKQISWGLRSCGKNTSSEQTNERLLSKNNNKAWEDTSSDDWKNEEDMIMTLEKDPEVCIKAICSLHREGLFNSFELLRNHHENMITALEKDPELCIKARCALRGTALAESIMCGDPYAELEKDEKGIRDCRIIAKVYSKELFEIYKKDKELEMQFVKWCEHRQKRCRFLKTSAGPPIFYVFNRPLEQEEDATLVDMMNLQETTMDQELEEAHKKLPEAGDNDEDEGDRDDTTMVIEEAGNASPLHGNTDDLNEPSSFV